MGVDGDNTGIDPELAEARRRIAELTAVLDAQAGPHRQADGAPLNSHQLLEALFENDHILVAILDPDFRFVRVNHAYARADGREPGFFTGKGHFELFPDAGNAAIFREVVATGRPHSALARPFRYAHRPDQGVTYWDWTLAPHKGPDGAVVRLSLVLVDVTDRIRALEAAARGEARYRSLAETVPAGVFRTDADGKGTYVNETLCRLAGRDAAFVTGETWPGILHPDDRDWVVGMWRDTVAHGAAFQAEYRYLRPDGTVVWVQANAAPERGPDGAVGGYVGAVADVTGRHRAQEALTALASAAAADLEAFARESSRHLAEAYDTHFAFMGLLTGDSPERVRTLAFWCGDHFADNLTYPLAGTPCADIVAGKLTLIPDGVAARYPDDPFLADMGIQSYFGAPLVGADGKAFGLVAVLDRRPLALLPGTEPIMGSFARRIAAEVGRNRAGARLRASEASLARAQAIAHVGHWEWDAASDTSRMSDEAWRILGLEPEPGGLPYKAFVGVIHADDRGDFLVRADAAKDPERREPFEADFRIVRPCGEVRHVHEQADTAFGPDGKVERMIGIVQDVTDLARAQADRERAHAQLLQAQKMEAVGLLAGGVAHDFNNLLTTMLGYVELASQRTAGPGDPLAAHLGEIRRAAERAASLTRQLLLFSRRQPMAFVPQDLGERMGSLLGMLTRLIGERVEVVAELAEGLWPVRADGVSIDQLVVNLAINARDAMPDGGRITIAAENADLSDADAEGIPDARAGRFVRLTVSDTGTGMDPETLARVFEPFFTTKDPGRGTGLGMSVAHGIARQHGGWIGAWSAPGEGTRFDIFLPALPDQVLVDATVAPRVHVDGAGRRVLVVEDEPALRAFAEAALSRSGFEVTAAGTADEAVVLFERASGDFALVFSDVVLPDRSGLLLVDELKALRPDLNVLLCSGYPDPQAGWSEVEDRGLPFIQKPYSLAVLLAAIDDGMGRDGAGDDGAAGNGAGGS